MGRRAWSKERCGGGGSKKEAAGSFEVGDVKKVLVERGQWGQQRGARERGRIRLLKNLTNTHRRGE